MMSSFDSGSHAVGGPDCNHVRIVPGEAMVPYPDVPIELSRPELPAAATTTMPAW